MFSIDPQQKRRSHRALNLQICFVVSQPARQRFDADQKINRSQDASFGAFTYKYGAAGSALLS
jgi:hypothetical protein